MNVNYSNISTLLKQQNDSQHSDAKRVTSKVAQTVQSKESKQAQAVQSTENKPVKAEKSTTAKAPTSPSSVKKSTSGVKSEPKSIKSPLQLLESFATTVKNSNLSKPTLLNYLESIDVSAKKLNAQDIKNIYTLIEDEPNLEKFKQKLAKFIEPIVTIKGDELKQKVSDSGVFLESKLLKEDSTNIKQMLSSTLNEIKNSITSSLPKQPIEHKSLHVEADNRQNITTKELQIDSKKTLLVKSNDKQNITTSLPKQPTEHKSLHVEVDNRQNITTKELQIDSKNTLHVKSNDKQNITTSLPIQPKQEKSLHVEVDNRQNITTKELHIDAKSTLHVEHNVSKEDVITKIDKVINELKKDIEITPKLLKSIETIAKDVTFSLKDDFILDESTKKIHSIIKDFSNFEKKELNLSAISDKIGNKIAQPSLLKEPLSDFSKAIDKIQSSFKEIIEKIPTENLNEFKKVSSLIKVEPLNIEALKKIVQDSNVYSGEKISYLHVDDKNELKLPILQRDGALLSSNVEKLKEIVNDLKQYATSTSLKALNPLQTLSEVVFKHKVPTPQQRELITKELVQLDSPKSVIKEIKELLKPEEITKFNAKQFLEVSRVAQSLKVDMPQVLNALDALTPLKQSVELLSQTV
ncbi:MAG: hypothetical protein U9N42_01505, partial [Campylobacterota bacterium]|nr:hypothetical protein [Campylobacterota bacterium]